MPVERQVGQAKKVKAAKTEAMSIDGKGRPLVGASVSPLDPERCRALDRVVDFLVADVAHFHTTKVMEAARKAIPDLSSDFIAGNVGTRQAAFDIVDELPRVDGFRAGIGSGSICITSEVTRVGAPTLFAVAQVASAMEERGMDIPIVADGGIRGPGDAVLGFAAGASVAMLGSMLAGTDESPSQRVTRKGKKYKVHRGMASAAARKARFAIDRYSVLAKGLDEGVEAYVPYVGGAEGVVARMENGLRAAFGYAGKGHYPGMHAEMVRVPYADANCIPLPGEPMDSVEDDFLMLADAFVGGWHAADLANVWGTPTVAIFGAGPIGLLTLMSVKMRGAGTVFMVDGVDARLKKAREFGGIPIDFRLGDPVDAIRAYRRRQGLPPGETALDGVDAVIDAVGFEALDVKNPAVEKPDQIIWDMARLAYYGGSLGVMGVYVKQDAKPAGNEGTDEWAKKK